MNGPIGNASKRILARWQTDGVITASTGAAIRNTLPPVAAGPHVAVAIGILGGLLIAAAFLAFVASNWVAIARPLRFAVLIAAIAGAYGIGAAFARAGRPVLADLGATVGSIIFGAAIALIGQMYHLGDDFAGGLLLWAVGALAGAALTGSRGALAVALAAGCIRSWANVPDSAGIPARAICAILAARCRFGRALEFACRRASCGRCGVTLVDHGGGRIRSLQLSDRR